MAPEPPAATNIFAPRCLPPSTPEGVFLPTIIAITSVAVVADPERCRGRGTPVGRRGERRSPPSRGAQWELAHAKEGDAPRGDSGGVAGLPRRGAAGRSSPSRQSRPAFPPGSAPAYSRGKFVGSCWWGVKRLSLSFLCLREERVADRRRHCPAGAAELELVALWCRRLRGRVRSATGGWRRRRRPGWRVAPCRGDGGRLGAPGCSPVGPLGQSGHHSSFHYSRQGLSTGVDRLGDRLPGVADPSPTPFVYVPGPTRKPRALLCVCCVKVTAELDLSPFFAPGDFPGKGLWGKALEGENLAGGGRRWVAQSVGSAPEEGEGAGGRLQLSTECRPLRDPISGAFPTGSLIGADRLSCASQGLPGLPRFTDPSLASLQPLTLFRGGVYSVLSAKGPHELWSARQVLCKLPSPARFSKAKPRGPRWTVWRLIVVPHLLEGMVPGLPISPRSCLRAQRMVSCLPPLI